MGGSFCIFCRSDWSTGKQEAGSVWEQIESLGDGATLSLPNESRLEQAKVWLTRYRPNSQIDLLVVRPTWRPPAEAK